MSPGLEPQSSAETLKAFAHPTRLMILQELLECTRCVTDMEELLTVKQANISQHLSVLRNAKLVDFAQDGALRCYYLVRPRLVRDLLRLLVRDESPVRRTADQINREKERAARAVARPAK